MVAKRNGGPCAVCGEKTLRPKNIYCCADCRYKGESERLVAEWLAGAIPGVTRWAKMHDAIRRYLFGKYNSSCQLCNWHEVNLTTGKVPLEVHHVDGNCRNGSPDNIQLLCPNCHSLTDTFRKLNNKSARYERTLLAKKKRVLAKLTLRVSKCPDAMVLAKELWENPTTIIGKKYGVSDNAVAKWARKLGLSKPPRGYWTKVKHGTIIAGGPAVQERPITSPSRGQHPSPQLDNVEYPANPEGAGMADER